jgi:hypothetical protein
VADWSLDELWRKIVEEGAIQDEWLLMSQAELNL